MQPPRQLDTLGREELLQTTRKLLAEADALSSRISALNEIGLAVNQSLDLAVIERVIAKQAKWLLDFEHCSVCLREGETWRIKTLFGAAEPTEVNLEAMPNLKSVMNTTRPLILRSGAESTFLTGYKSQIIIPLSADSGFLGTINFAAQAENVYTHDDMRIGYMLSLQLASAIRNANVVTELKVIREELRLRVEELDAFSHTIAHDLKSPLSNIMLRSQIAAMRFKDELPAQALDIIASIEQSSQLMNRMIDQLLMLAKLRQTDEQRVVVKMQAAANAAVQRFSAQVEAKAIQITVGELPDAYGQQQWIEEVFANLISNAIKYIGEKNAAPTITITSTMSDGKPRFEVRDNGIGIKPENQGKLFEMFSRVQDTETANIEGIGLGLSIVRRIVKKLQGEVGVESEFGKGTTFWFTLPPAPAPAPSAPVTIPAAAPDSASPVILSTESAQEKP